jgi:5-methylcytosine-specific restriction endonuclease McrA
MDAGISRKQKLNGTEWALARQRAIASKDPVCAICHKYIDVELPMKDPETGTWNALAVEVDHIVPRARGGALYEVDNLQLSHSACNRKKGARMDSDYDANTVANPVPLSNAW